MNSITRYAAVSFASIAIGTSLVACDKSEADEAKPVAATSIPSEAPSATEPPTMLEQMTEWVVSNEPEFSRVTTDLARTSGQMRKDGLNMDFEGVADGCEELGSLSVEGLALEPAPDPKLQSAWESAMNAYGRAEQYGSEIRQYNIDGIKGCTNAIVQGTGYIVDATKILNKYNEENWG